jgi:hypothetical protein
MKNSFLTLLLEYTVWYIVVIQCLNNIPNAHQKEEVPLATAL